MKSKTEFCIPLLKKGESYESIISRVREVYGTGISKSTLSDIIRKNNIVRHRKPRQSKINKPTTWSKNHSDSAHMALAYETIRYGLNLYNKAVKYKYFTTAEREQFLALLLDYNNLK